MADWSWSNSETFPSQSTSTCSTFPTLETHFCAAYQLEGKSARGNTFMHLSKTVLATSTCITESTYSCSEKAPSMFAVV